MRPDVARERPLVAHVYLSIGSNLDDPPEQLRRAIDALRAFGRVCAVSPFYRTKPWGTIPDQPDFVNGVVAFETDLEPAMLLAEIKTLERRAGRNDADPRWGPRPIDVDILTYDDRRIDEPELTIPHPRMNDRAFVLVPLADLDERFIPARDALPGHERTGITPLSS